jgi:hypothetical protein
MTIWLTTLGLIVSLGPAMPDPIVEVEEGVTRTQPANNGAGPLWCYGAPLIARDAEDVYASVIQTGADVPPLCNTRWQLWHRGLAGWKLEQSESEYRQREPCPIALFPGGDLFLSVNPSTQPPGTKYGPCRPSVLRFDRKNPSAAPVASEPAWAPDTRFTDHSYRGFAADGPSRELVALNIHAESGDQFVSFRNRDGRWHGRGRIRFPIRACYPQVGLRNRAAHVMAIGDIVEPNEAWRRLKKDVLRSDWDYVFRRLFYAWTPNLAESGFGEPIEVDTVEDTGGHIANLDLVVRSDGACHLLYIRRPHQYPFLRDRYFPGRPMTSHLVHAVIRKGNVVERRILAQTPDEGDGIEPVYARFHVLADGGLCVILAGIPMPDGRRGRFGNFVGRIDDGLPPAFKPIPLVHPFGTFFTSTTRGGSAPSDMVDMFGTSQDHLSLRYARVRVR